MTNEDIHEALSEIINDYHLLRRRIHDFDDEIEAIVIRARDLLYYVIDANEYDLLDSCLLKLNNEAFELFQGFPSYGLSLDALLNYAHDNSEATDVIGEYI
jgi:hypothetical protein